MKASIAEKDSPDSDYKAEVEEYWVSPDKWRRTIKSPEFSQTVIQNGDKRFEQDSGDYYPQWLREFVIALTNPLPMSEELKSVTSPVQPGAMSCARFSKRVGTAPADNSIFYVFCFDKSDLLESVVTPDYSVDFKEYKSFEGKQIARYVSSNPEPGTQIEARVTELAPLSAPDETMFEVKEPTPEAEQVKSIMVPEQTARGLAIDPPQMIWPPVRDGKTAGVLSVLISVDRTGHVRETLGLNSDHPWMTDAARQQLLEWRFKPAAIKGVPTQVESILTFAYSTKIGNPYPVLDDEAGRKQALRITEPSFSRGVAPPGTSFGVRICVDETGKVIGITNNNNVATRLFLAVNAASHDWKFKPLMQDGKPTEFYTDLKFRVP